MHTKIKKLYAKLKREEACCKLFKKIYLWFIIIIYLIIGQDLTEKAFFIEDLIENKKSFDHKIHSLLTINRTGFLGNIIDKVSKI